MNDTSAPPTLWQRSTTSRFLRWLFSWRTARRALMALLALVTLVAFGYGVENWRGRRVWHQFKTEHEARGERLDLKAFVPPPVPDEQNLAMTPLLKPLHTFVLDEKRKQHRLPPNSPQPLLPISIHFKSGSRMKEPANGSLDNGILVDLAAWQEFYRGNTNYPQPAQPQSPALDVLTALSKYDAAFQELHAAAATRPLCRFNVPYDDDCPFAILLPHLAAMKGLALTTALRANARVAAGQTDAALTEMRLGLRLAEGVKPEPILISYLVRLAMLHITFQPAAEGLARHAWTDAQLAELDKLLGSVDLLSDYQLAMRGERGFGAATVDWLKRASAREAAGLMGDESSDFQFASELAFRFIPDGWLDQNKVNMGRMFDQYSLPAVDAKARRIHPDLAGGVESSPDVRSFAPYKFMARLLMPALSKVALRTARQQTLLDQLRIACALERHRLAKGAYPATLDVLVPRYLAAVPNDLIAGEPLKYQKTGETYQIYAVGWNQQDDGGKPAFLSRLLRTDSTRGDWVWRPPSDWPTGDPKEEAKSKTKLL
ncbi:MAG: hypothetical protein HZA90_12440 [Verrucomicrobia bacterium]|nr:hypothetical protein [Verrucomicrobiota bacterium]